MTKNYILEKYDLSVDLTLKSAMVDYKDLSSYVNTNGLCGVDDAREIFPDMFPDTLKSDKDKFYYRRHVYVLISIVDALVEQINGNSLFNNIFYGLCRKFIVNAPEDLVSSVNGDSHLSSNNVLYYDTNSIKILMNELISKLS